MVTLLPSKDKRAACERLLEMIEARLRTVTLNYPSFHAQEQVTLARRLYQPRNLDLSADDFLKLQRRFTMVTRARAPSCCPHLTLTATQGLIMLRDKPEVQSALEQLDEYNESLREHSMRDYEVESIELDEPGQYRTLLLRFIILLGIVMLSVPVGGSV